jgi:microcompartment protein CcmL/EutN
MITSIGLIEMNAIARGIEAADAMLKAASVTLSFAKPVCPGKFIVLVHGDVGAVKSSVAAGVGVGGGAVVNSLISPRVHPTLIPAINATVDVSAVDALGVVEYFDIVSAIVGADAAAKTGNVRLIEVRLGMGIGGKSYFKLCGEVADVKASVKASTDEALRSRGVIVSTCVIPSPDPALFREML